MLTENFVVDLGHEKVLPSISLRQTWPSSTDFTATSVTA